MTTSSFVIRMSWKRNEKKKEKKRKKKKKMKKKRKKKYEEKKSHTRTDIMSHFTECARLVCHWYSTRWIYEFNEITMSEKKKIK